MADLLAIRALGRSKFAGDREVTGAQHLFQV